MATNQEIWIASYLIPDRFDTFKGALKSFAAQTVECRVVVSVCGPESWRAKAWAEELLKDIEYEIFLYEERLSQFDQIYLLYKKAASSDQWISFCDDDDYYMPKRIEIQGKYIAAIDRSLYDSIKCGALGGCSDFGCMCVPFETLDKYFSREDRKQYEASVPPDCIFMALCRSLKIHEDLYVRRNSLYSRTYIEDRGDGTHWWKAVLYK